MSRPDWLPESWKYEHMPQVRCLYCNAVYTNTADRIEGDKHRFIDWCDSPECEQAAREAITGQSSA